MRDGRYGFDVHYLVLITSAKKKVYLFFWTLQSLLVVPNSPLGGIVSSSTSCRFVRYWKFVETTMLNFKFVYFLLGH